MEFPCNAQESVLAVVNIGISASLPSLPTKPNEVYEFYAVCLLLRLAAAPLAPLQSTSSGPGGVFGSVVTPVIPLLTRNLVMVLPFSSIWFTSLVWAENPSNFSVWSSRQVASKRYGHSSMSLSTLSSVFRGCAGRSMFQPLIF